MTRPVRRRVVVTGAAGFVAGHVLARLEADGAEILGIDRRPAVPGAPGTHLVADLADRRAGLLVAEVCGRADAVIHLAGRGGVRERGREADAARDRDNVVVTRRVVAAVPPGCRLVVASSSSVYGGAVVRDGTVRASHEDDPVAPRGAYARSKVLVEAACRERRDRGGDVTVVRPFTVTGPGQRADMAVHRWLAAARTGRPIQVLGSLDRCRDVTDVRDVARALVELTRVGAPELVNLGTGCPVTLAEMLEATLQAIGRPTPVDLAPADPRDPGATRADTTRLEATLGWVPRTDIRSLVADQFEALTRSGAVMGGAAAGTS